MEFNFIEDDLLKLQHYATYKSIKIHFQCNTRLHQFNVFFLQLIRITFYGAFKLWCT